MLIFCSALEVLAPQKPDRVPGHVQVRRAGDVSHPCTPSPANTALVTTTCETQVYSTTARCCVSSSDLWSLVVVCVCQPDIDVFPVPGDLVMRTREINNGACECDSIKGSVVSTMKKLMSLCPVACYAMAGRLAMIAMAGIWAGENLTGGQAPIEVRPTSRMYTGRLKYGCR